MERIYGKTPWIKEVYISKISWLLPPSSLDSEFTEQSLFLNAPNRYDASIPWYEVDALCNGKVTEFTPPAAIKQVSLLRFMSLRPDNAQWENPVQTWVANGWYEEEFWELENVIWYASDEICERSDLASDIILKTTTEDDDSFVRGSNFIELAYRSNHPIIRLDVFVGGESIKQIPLTSKKEGVYKWSFEIPATVWDKTDLIIRAVDSQYFSKEEIKTIKIIDVDTTAPEITISEPTSENNTISASGELRLKWYVRDRSELRSINIYNDGNPLKIWITWRSFSFMLKWSVLWSGSHKIEVEAVDMWFNTSREAINVDVIADEEEDNEVISEETDL